MSSEEPSVSSKAELNAELQRVILEAHENGINVEGGFECRNVVEQPDWDVVVTEVEKNGRTS